jgi:two-component system chemotaxis sensor kinase CheA
MSQEEVFRNFMTEMGDRLAEFEQGLAELEQNFRMDTVHQLFRAIHTIKGGAGFFELGNITRLSHQLEDLLMNIREEDLAFDPAMVPVLFEAADVLRDMHESSDHGKGLDIDELCLALKFKPGHKPATSGPIQKPVVKTESANPATQPQRKTAMDARQVDTHGAPETSRAAQAHTSRSAPMLPAVPAAQTPPTPKTEVSTQSAIESGVGARQETIRVKVDLLDRLMELTGEIVVARNQLLRQLDDGGQTLALSSMAHMISDLQQVVLQTRMQPVGGTFTKFNRIVRDLSRQLEKPIRLLIRGDETELDRSIIEALSDPLTHLIRNCADHGVERSDARVALGKEATATIRLEARNEGGQVAITVEDDGRGIDTAKVRAKALANGLIHAGQAAEMSDNEIANLIFHPGLSTAEEITDLSGRGVGMDVVKSTIEKLGGVIELETRVGSGTRVSIYLPTTLTIMSSLIVRIGEDRFAVPHSELSEVIVVRPGDELQIDRIREQEVYRLRGQLIPILTLQRIAGNGLSSGLQLDEECRFLVLKAGVTTFGLVIDEIDHTEEIVIKPLPQILKKMTFYAGSSILGDSDVAMVISANGICHSQNLHLQDLQAGVAAGRSVSDLQLLDLQEKQDLLVFRYGTDEQFAVPLSLVFKVEIIERQQIETIANRDFIHLEGRNILLVYLDEHLALKPLPEDLERLYIFTTKINKFEVAVVASSIEESIHTRLNLDSPPMNESVVLGVTKLHGKLTFLLDLFSLAEKVSPDIFRGKVFSETPTKNRLLVVDDTPFFRDLEKKYFESVGFQVTLAFNGQDALDLLSAKPRAFDLVVTDIVMPVMDGYDLLKNIRNHPQLAHIPVIALTSFAQEENLDKAKSAGFFSYALKTNKETILDAVSPFVLEG